MYDVEARAYGTVLVSTEQMKQRMVAEVRTVKWDMAFVNTFLNLSNFPLSRGN